LKPVADRGGGLDGINRRGQASREQGKSDNQQGKRLGNFIVFNRSDKLLLTEEFDAIKLRNGGVGVIIFYVAASTVLVDKMVHGLPKRLAAR